MRRHDVSVGFLPLSDAAPLIAALELGFAEEEGLTLSLRRATSWSALRDLLSFGHLDAALMLSPIPVAAKLGLGGSLAEMDVLMVTSLGGERIVCSEAIARQVDGVDRADPHALRAALRAPMRIGVPFPFSIHAELLYRWLGEGIRVQTVPPPLLPDAMASGEVDLFIVGEPWASLAVERGIAKPLLRGTEIWRRPPDKVLAMRHAQVEDDPELTGRLMRALWRACRWLRQEENRQTIAEIMAGPLYLDLAPDLVERSLQSGVEFFEGCATFPWRSQAEWIGERLAARHGLSVPEARLAAQGVFRSDLYRRHLQAAGADLPAASARLEGAVTEPSLHPAASGRVLLLPDSFFDGAVFEPRPEVPA